MNVVCALIERGGLLLVAQRAAGKALAGKWEFPGGKIDPGETAFEAIVREIHEELGCFVEPIQQLDSCVHHYPTFIITLHPIICQLSEGEPRALEHAAVGWVDRADIRSLDLAEADIPVLEEYLSLTSSGL